MRKVLVIMPYERVYPPMNGGMIRCFNLLVQLSLHSEVTVIINQDLTSFSYAREQYPSLQKSKIFSTQDFPRARDIFSLLPEKLQIAFRFRWQKRTLKGPADTNFLLVYPLLNDLLRKEKYDWIFLENLSSINFTSLIRQRSGHSRIIYDAHNVDTNLAGEDYKKGIIGKRTYELVYSAESGLSKTIDGIAVCSVADLAGFQGLNRGSLEAAVIPNGVKIYPLVPSPGTPGRLNRDLLFCGSLDYAPNVEGLLWFYKDVWPILQETMPGIRLTIIGAGVPDAQLTTLRSANAIRFIGKVPDVSDYYKSSIVAIVPLLSGSGTRLKILEAMSLGVPVVSTPKGAEGIEYQNGRNILIADAREKFADSIIRLIEDGAFHSAVKKNAHDLVCEKYDWNIIGKKLNFFFDSFYE